MGDIKTLTQKGKDLIPILIEYIVWSYKYDSETETEEDFAKQATNNRKILFKRHSRFTWVIFNSVNIK